MDENSQNPLEKTTILLQNVLKQMRQAPLGPDIPESELTPDQRRLRDERKRYREELLLRVYPVSIRRQLLEGHTSGRLTHEQEADLNATIDAGLYVLSGLEDGRFKVPPKCGDDLRRLISWKRRRLLLNEARRNASQVATFQEDDTILLCGGNSPLASSPDERPENDPAVLCRVTELCRSLMKSLKPEQRDILRLRMQGLGWEEIESKLGLGRRGLEHERNAIRNTWTGMAGDLTDDESACLLEPLLAALRGEQ
jgi:hypothetical protein